MTLEEFIDYESKRLQLFNQWYVKQNRVNPEHYPLVLTDDNSGVWDEMFQDFDPEDPFYQS